MGSTYTDLIDGISTSTAFKAPVRVATTANITLSGEQTIDGVAVVSGDRVLVKDQTDSKENGIWVADTSAWKRAKDFDGNRDVRKGTMVLVNEGALGAGTIWRVTSSDSITIGTDNITFSKSFVSVEFTIAADVDYANATSGLTADNVQDALDELADEKFDKTGGSVSGNVSVTGAVSATTSISAGTSISAASLAGDWIAMQAEAEAGSNNDQVMTPLRTKQAVAAHESFANALFHARDVKESGTASGSFTSGAPRTRDLNTVVTNQISGASLSNNQITLPAGTYLVLASAPANQVDRNQARLQNVTDGTTTILGTAEFASSQNGGTSTSFVKGRFTIAASKTFELQHECQTTNGTSGFGFPNSFGNNLVFAEVMIWKVA